MLASARELGLRMSTRPAELSKEASREAMSAAVLGLDDRIMTLKLTPNRADCLSILGRGA